MADYISTLTGAAMDAALQDMAEHNSEAWAVGERNGVAVDSGDVTYHNNAQYYAQQAQSIAPASVTEAVRWDIAQTALTDAQREQARENINAADNDTAVQVVAQTFTSAQQEIARANIAAGSTNPNLLDNPWFTVNQRNVANGVTVNANNFIADRWQATGTNGATRNADGTITIGTTLFHKFPDLGITGKTVTISVMYADNTVESSTHLYNGASTYVLDLPSLGTSRLYTATNQINLGASTKNLKAVKLELGTVSTLANDTPPDYGTELAKCQRYFTRLKAESGFGVFGTGAIYSSTGAYIAIPISMRITPTSGTTSGAFRLMGSSTWTGITLSYSANSNSHCARFDITGTNTWTAGQACILSAANDANAYIDLSADL